MSLDKDPFFNTYDPDRIDPLWKALLKKLIGWEKNPQDERAIIEEIIRKNYLEYVAASITKAGAVEISVTHTNPKLAARYSNTFMEQIRQLIEEEDNKSKEFRLSYLAETLADALQEMENAQSNMKEYALQNSTAAPENFIAGSIKLDSLRMEKREAEEFIYVLKKLGDLVKLGDLTVKSYEALKASSPLVDDVNFRRILGMSETISAWSWPNLDTIVNVSATLHDRVNRLNVEIADIEENAKEFASNAEELARLTRDMKIAEATFKVLTEQVKSQSLAAGFKPDTFKVFAYARPPITPSSPKRNLILALGAILGIIFGSVISLLNSVRRGVFYTQSSMISHSEAAIAVPSKLIRRITKLPASKMLVALEKLKPTKFDETDVVLANKNLVYVLSADGQPLASQTARLLATRSHQSGRSVLIFNQAFDALKGQEDKPPNKFPELTS